MNILLEKRSNSLYFLELLPLLIRHGLSWLAICCNHFLPAILCQLLR